jgi:predicted O-methyltransferase YrrM
VLPPRVAWFQWRARRLAHRESDQFSLDSAARPQKLALILAAARGCRHVAELGTGTGWTSVSLLLADSEREVVSYDPYDRSPRERYVQLAGERVRRRLTFIQAPGIAGPDDGQRFDLLFIDSSHALDETRAELEIWRGGLVDGALVIFDDFEHPDYPGVREAVRQLNLSGHCDGGLFFHRWCAPAPDSEPA